MIYGIVSSEHQVEKTFSCLWWSENTTFLKDLSQLLPQTYVLMLKPQIQIWQLFSECLLYTRYCVKCFHITDFLNCYQNSMK